MLDRLLSVVAPHNCRSCGEQGRILCEVCKNDIIEDTPGRCLVCTTPTSSTNLCNTCARTSALSDAWYVSERRDGLKRLIDAYKFQATREAAPILAELLDARLPHLPKNTTVCPVPTLASHKRERGFGHTERIVKHLSRLRKLPHANLLRALPHGTQHMKSRKDRLTGAQSAFIVTVAVPETVLLVDDIYTTGATLTACAQLLEDAGAKTVYGAIIARQPLDASNDL